MLSLICCIYITVTVVGIRKCCFFYLKAKHKNFTRLLKQDKIFYRICTMLQCSYLFCNTELLLTVHLTLISLITKKLGVSYAYHFSYRYCPAKIWVGQMWCLSMSSALVLRPWNLFFFYRPILDFGKKSCLAVS
jgi:hypothetical protein